MAEKHKGHPAHKHIQRMAKQMDQHHAAMTQMMDQLANSLQQPDQMQQSPQEAQAAAPGAPAGMPAGGVSPLGGQAR
jgi:uncharacterized coiled-coil DUF342 family protein